MLRIDVGAGDTLLAGYLRTPPVGLCELAWNAFDEDAKRVSISIEDNAMGGLEQIVVEDDGTGMDFITVSREFAKVGDSYKATPTGSRSDGGRPVHGRLGRGRYSAFSLGDSVTWESTTRAGEELVSVIVRGNREDLKGFDVEEPTAPLQERPGTRVLMTRVTESAQKSFDSPESIRTRLTTEFALHLERFDDFEIDFLGSPIDAASVIEVKETVDVELPEGVTGSAKLTVIEWKLKSVERRLYLCDSNGSVITEVYAQIQAPGIQLSAYLMWDGFRDHSLIMESENAQDDSDAPIVDRVVGAGRAALREYVATLNRRKEKATVERWRSEGIYPYTKEEEDRNNSTASGNATRDAFEYVALAASRSVDEAKSRQTKRLALALLRETFETDPDRLFPILKKVTNLPNSRIDELQQVLDRTSLSSLIQAGHKVGSRIDFLNGLDEILHERSTRARLHERTQLHRMLANETWVFGEEWATTGDDERLGKVLKKFKNFIQEKDAPEVDVADPLSDGAVDYEPRREDGRIAIPDLVLGRKMQVSENKFKFLVVELKRPSHDLTDGDVSQIRSYADAIVNDERLNTPGVEWTFVLVGNDVTRTVDGARQQPMFPFGVVQIAPFRIEVRRWSELIADAHHRMKFVQDSLDYKSSHMQGMDSLRTAYAQFLPPMDEAEPREDASD
ncbi:ATP-binding protein [Gordonia rubripertincta]|uniref:ATP-binding protein n=1 Tax=Gordonia rubripertincta TaxID=36822 RepID=A0AAW4G8F7_GORRU|nr:ATP-binding protein [Gordonia rubripertincta]MBM7279300.1 ATP-binding protein [Gordonia rubripertincta]